MPIEFNTLLVWTLDSGATLDSGLNLDEFNYLEALLYGQEYAIGRGWNTTQDNWTNFEEWFTTPPRIDLRPLLGSEVDLALSGNEIRSGERVVRLTYLAAKYTALESYVNNIFQSGTVYSGGTDRFLTDTSSEKVTLRVRHSNNQFRTYNAWAYLPVEGEDYTHYDLNDIQDLQMRFRLVTY